LIIIDMKTFFALVAIVAAAAAAQPTEETHLMTISEALEKINGPKNNGRSSSRRGGAMRSTRGARRGGARRGHGIAQKKAKEPKGEVKEEPAEEEEASADEAEVMLADEEVDHSGEFFKVGEHGMLGSGGYERVTTPRFAADSDDIFMRSMIEQYAQEGKNKDGSPNGQFWMSEVNARAASSEVLDTHRGLKGAARENYLKTYFPRSWAHFDVNRTGMVEAIKMPQLMRFLSSDQQMYLW
jgi:hypothetical protein